MLPDDRMVETVANAIWPLDDLSSDDARDRLRADTRCGLEAAFAALDREALIEAAAKEMAEQAGHSNIGPWWDTNKRGYLVRAERVLRAVGLIA